MESVAVLRSFNCTVVHMQSPVEKPGLFSMCNVTSKKSLFTQALSGAGRLNFSPVGRKGVFLPCVKASETTLAASTDVASLDGNSRPEKKIMNSAVFPNGFEELLLEVCDETDVAELKLKIGSFEMNVRRNIASPPPPLPPAVSYSEPTTAAPSKPVAESTPTPPSKSSSEKPSPFKNISSEKSRKLESLEASGSTGYVIVSSPTVGSFRTGRTVKGKKQPPLCKVGDVIKEGQIVGYLDQFGTELPLRSDVAGEVLKLLYSDGEAIGYGDPLMAVLPSFHGIK